MPDDVKNIRASHQTWMRRLALLFLIIFITVSLMAQITIIANANHECVGDGCPICKLVKNAKMLLKQIGKIVIAVSVLQTALFIVVNIMINGLVCDTPFTLVKIKVRMNN